MNRIRLFFILFIAVLSSSFNSGKKTVVFFGDSITAGYGLSKEQAFPSILNAKLKKEGLDCEIINAGLSGETSAGGLSRVSWILKKPVDIFVLELGANDALRGLPLDVTKENLQKIMDKVRAKNPKVTFILAGMMVPPNLGDDYAREFSAIFPALARENDSILIPFLLDGVAGNESLNLPDGIHPNAEGHRILADNVLPFLKKALE